jgi:hypothetical protein
VTVIIGTALMTHGFEALPPVASRVSCLACDMKFTGTNNRILIGE